MRRLAAVLLAVTACTDPGSDEPDVSTHESNITTAVRHERFGLIRDSAAEMGLYNAALLAGIAISETNLAHCQSEATYACKGPASSSCGGGPIIAGAADGACSLMQGGLGMFQFDAGTYADTVGTYGDSILTIEGNTAQAVNFVVVRLVMDIAQVTDWMSAVAWLNEVPMDASTMRMDEWADFIVCRYNGCCSSSSTCTTRRAGYRDNAIDAFGEMGASFWDESQRCPALPADGVIDQRSNCYVAGGDPRYWRRIPTGYADTSEWTGTTAAMTGANFGRWLVRPTRATRYSVEVYLDGGTVGTSTMAKYKIVHAGMTDTVTVDQTSATGFVSLGDFDFAATGDEYVELADNTGEPGATDKQLMFDAIRVLPLDGGPIDPPIDPDPMDDGGGCCQTSGSGGHGNLLAMSLVGLGLFRRRRRRR